MEPLQLRSARIHGIAAGSDVRSSVVVVVVVVITTTTVIITGNSRHCSYLPRLRREALLGEVLGL